MNLLVVKIILRKFKINLSFTIIKILGLCVGLSCSIFISLWIFNELEYDKHINESENIYRLMSYGEKYWSNGVIWVPGPLGPITSESIPDIKNSLRIQPAYSKVAFRYGDKKFYENMGIFADTSFFSFFNFNLLYGDINNCLLNPNSIVISKDFAQKYFGLKNPVGEIIETDNDQYIISAVLDDIRNNSSLKANFIIPINSLEKYGQSFSNWNNINVITFCKLNKDVNIENTAADLTKLARSKHSIQYERDSAYVKLQAFDKIHLDGEHGHYLEIFDLGSQKMVFIFSSIVFLILILAIINFINLNTASSDKLKKEIHIRRVLGASRPDFIKYFYIESLLVVSFAFCMAILLVALFLPKFNMLSVQNLLLSEVFNLNFIFLLFVLFILTWLLSASYPAFYLSSLNKVGTINFKGGVKSQSKAISRKAMVVVQFIITSVLIISFITILKQINFIKNKDLGFDTHNVIYLPLKGEFANKYEQIKRKLLNNENILYVSNQDYLWASLNNRTTGFKWEGKDPETSVEMHIPQVGFDYIESLNIEVIEGRSFSKDFATDSNSFIINQSAFKKIGMQNAIDMPFSVFDGKKWQNGNIIGIIKNMNFKSLKINIEPMVMRFLKYPEGNSDYGVMLIRFKDKMQKEVVNEVELLWNTVNSEIPFEYKSLSDKYEEFYVEENNMFKVISFFTILAIAISCLGLFGLITFTIERREKEIGIRKANGADAYNILILLIWDFMKLIGLGYAIALPVSYYLMNGWLQGFAYRIKLDFTIYAGALIIALVVSLIAILYKSSKASLKNPIDVLRYE